VTGSVNLLTFEEIGVETRVIRMDLLVDAYGKQGFRHGRVRARPHMHRPAPLDGKMQANTT
jgi:hypothetical protein